MKFSTKDAKSIYTTFSKYLKKNKPYSYLILSFIVISILVVVIALVKIASSEPDYVYAKVKISQGLWWASTQKPGLWFINAIKKGEIEYNLLGKPVAEILEVRYYPVPSSPLVPLKDQYDIYATVKLASSYNKRTKKYVFKRSTIAVGSPIELEFPTSQVTGTVIDMRTSPFEYEDVEKEILLTHEEGYFKDLPFAYENIKVGDKYFDGTEDVFEVTDKKLKRKIIVSADLYGKLVEHEVTNIQNIIITAKVKVRKDGNSLIYGEEQVLNPGARINFSTPNYNYQDFIVLSVEE